MKNAFPKYGIWGGRFQIIHKGHEHMLKFVAGKYSHVCIGIVNPHPQTPAWNILEHERFQPEKNPLNYFQRVYLWDMLLKNHSIEAVIVPHWHPRKSLALESTFLPQSSREWVIPYLPDEEFKIKDYEDAGEKVYVLDDMSAELRAVNASDIRRLYDKNDSSFKVNIPEKLQTKTKVFLDGKDCGEQFIVIPMLDNKLHPLLICGGIQLSLDTGKRLIFAPVVNVADEDEWWKSASVGKDYFTFYQKHEIINSTMRSLHFHDYMVIPIIVKNKQCQMIDDFLPESNNRSWLFVSGISSSKAFKPFNAEKILKIDSNAISNEIYADVFSVLFEQFRQRHYYDKFFEDSEDDD